MKTAADIPWAYPPPWRYGVRNDESIWISFGNPEKGAFNQFDFEGTEACARMICGIPDLIARLQQQTPAIDTTANAHHAKLAAIRDLSQEALDLQVIQLAFDLGVLGGETFTAAQEFVRRKLAKVLADG